MEEAPIDPGSLLNYPAYTDKELEGHRARTVYVGLHIPGYVKKRHHRRHKHHHHRNGCNKKKEDEDERPITPPSERVQFILGEEDEDGTHESHPLFSEMEELHGDGEEMEWRETARWVKFEEDVEEGGNRWSKPHVATISLHSLFELRSCIVNGTVMLDMNAFSLDQIADLLMENMVNSGHLKADIREKVKSALLRRHRHLYERKHEGSRLPLIRSLAEIGRNSSKTSPASNGDNMPKSPSTSSLQTGHPTSLPTINSATGISAENNNSSTDLHHKLNQAFMKKIPHGAEAANVLVGDVDFLDCTIAAFIRLNHAHHLGDLTEVPLPTKFLFIILGPQGSLCRFHEVGRAMATILSDEVFHDVAYKAKSRKDLLAGVDEFLDAVTVLPPGAWDPNIRIEPPRELPSQESRKKQDHIPPEEQQELKKIEDEKELERAGLRRSGRLFGGLCNDIKRKLPLYLSDFKDAFAIQSIASIFFLYFACLTPIITFGGLLGEATDNNIAAMESLLAAAICGIGYGLFSGQPLTILGSTGPVLVFENILYEFCREYGLEYLPFRMWIGLWTSLILIILVAFDASVLVCYITRFTEENFSTLISLIFIIQAIKKLIHIGDKNPVLQHTIDHPPGITCFCSPPNDTSYANSSEWLELSPELCSLNNGTMIGSGCSYIGYVPDVFFFSIFLFSCTFFVSIFLKNFKTSTFFPTKVRQYISDFSVVIAIISMSILDIMVGLNTPKLIVPQEFKPTSPHRTWFIPLTGKNPSWIPVAALVPALLATILIFMDQQITAVIVNRKENKLKKGAGYHLDLFVLSFLIAICSIFGLPWFVAATVLAITHVNSLKVDSECSAPGEKPQFLGVREQRVTQIFIFILVGLSVFFTSVLKHIPMPVLFGVFLYMGFTSIKGSQFFDRCLLMLMPQKYQPDFMFIRNVPTNRIHMFTLIQIACLLLLWGIKSYKTTSILFPIMLVVMILVRRFLECIFTEHELEMLDDLMPDTTKRTREEEEKQKGDIKGGFMPESNSSGNVAITLANGNILKVPIDRIQDKINITEQLSESSLWKSIHQQAHKCSPSYGLFENEKFKCDEATALTDEEKRRLSTMTEEDEDDLTFKLHLDSEPLTGNSDKATVISSETSV